MLRYPPINISFLLIRDYKLGRTALFYLISSFFILGCSNNQISELYRSTRNSSKSGPVIVKAGNHQIQQGDSSFARDNYSVLTPVEIAELPSNSRRLALTALMLRKLTIEDGLDKGIFDTPDAHKYILPRLEKVMEDYYYYKLSEEEIWSERLRALKNDKRAIESFLKDDPAFSKRKLSQADISESLHNAIERIIAEKRLVEYSRIKQNILVTNQPIEVIQ